MIIEVGELVAVNTFEGLRTMMDTKTSIISICQGVRGIMLDEPVKHCYWKDWHCKVLIGGAGVWFIKVKCIARVRMSFRKNELLRIACLQ